LREILRAGSGAEAIEAVGLLSRLDITALTEFLPGRVREWSRVTQDRVVRHIAASGTPERGRLLLGLFGELDPLIQSLALDEIGMSANREAISALLALAEGAATKGGPGYLRLKAIEALGRLRATSAASGLRKIAEAKQMFRWRHPPELRIAALQALGKIDPEWTAAFVPRCGFSATDLGLAPLDPVEHAPWLRQRRYARLRLAQPLIATVNTDKDSFPLEIKSLSLGGGLAAIKRHLAPGTYVSLKLQSGLRGLRATAVMRDWRAQDVAFEIADMDLEERSRFRRLLITLTAPSAPVLAGPRPERSSQAILTSR